MDDAQETASPPSRAVFTPAQLLQAEYVGHVSRRERERRRQIPTYPIDNVTRDVVADRDDGVFVEAEPRDGGYRVHVTIADVAAHVRARSPLAQAAWQRAFTVYGPGWTDPMFPKLLEENLSLEHNKERLGVTVSITLDKQFRPIHTNFAPVITHPDNTSYAEAHERIASDPQFQLMSDISMGIRHHYFQGKGEIWDELFKQRRSSRSRSAQQMAAEEMVATYMLLANSCVAEFFSQSGLPFLYRNFDDVGGGDTHAYYSAHPLKHTALERVGLKGAYCHFTSPIRRAPDYYNGIMVHYVIDTLQSLIQTLQKEFPAIEQKKLHHAVWAHAPQLFSIVQDVDAKHVVLKNKKLLDLYRTILAETVPEPIHGVDAKLRAMGRSLSFAPPPLTEAELAGYAAHMNALSHAPFMKEISKQNEKYEISLEKMEAVYEMTPEQLAAMKGERFSTVLQAAALTGDMPRRLFDETMERLRTGKLLNIQDYFSIFILAQHTDVPRWIALKREVARKIKHDPGLVNSLYGKLEHHLAPATLEIKTIPVPTGESSEHQPTHVMVGLVTMNGVEAQQRLAPPFYSVGHDARAAKSHAIYSFLESYAFGEIQPVQQTAVPNLLYAELEVEGVARHELLSRMVANMGAQMEVKQSNLADGYAVHITVHGGELPTPITVDAKEENVTEAMKVALRRVLRNPSFKMAASRYQQEEGHETLNPHTLLTEMVEAQGGNVRFNPLTREKHGGSLHQVEAFVTLNGRESRYVGAAPNIDRAKRLASVKALEVMGWSAGADQANAQSWVTDAQLSKKKATNPFKRV